MEKMAFRDISRCLQHLYTVDKPQFFVKNTKMFSIHLPLAILFSDVQFVPPFPPSTAWYFKRRGGGGLIHPSALHRENNCGSLQLGLGLSIFGALRLIREPPRGYRKCQKGGTYRLFPDSYNSKFIILYKADLKSSDLIDSFCTIIWKLMYRVNLYLQSGYTTSKFLYLYSHMLELEIASTYRLQMKWGKILA